MKSAQRTRQGRTRSGLTDFGRATVYALLLTVCVGGCGEAAAQHQVSWEFEGDDVRVIETLVDGEGERRMFFRAASMDEVTTSDDVVTVGDRGETFTVRCLDETQAAELADILRAAVKKADD